MKLYLKSLMFITIVSLIAYESNGQSKPPSTTNQKVNIGHTIHGTGQQKVIVLHDWMGDYQNWVPLLPYLSLDQFTYAFMEVRGYGKSIDLVGAYTSDEITQDIFDLADRLGWSRFHLVGHSMTGMAVQKAAVLDADNRITSVIAVTPAAAKGFPLDEENRQFFLSIINNRAVAKMGYNAMTGARLTSNWQAARAQRFLEKSDPVACKAYLDMWSMENFSSRVIGMEKPFLVITGQFDHPGFQLTAQKENFKDFRQVAFEEILNAGHYPMEETPVFLATIIEQYLDKHK